MDPELIATVQLDKGPKKPLDYLIPKTLKDQLFPGSAVKVPLRGREVLATILRIEKKKSDFALRPISDHFSKGNLSAPLLRLAKWMANYYLTDLKKVLPLFSPTFSKKGKEKTQYQVTSLLSKEALKKTAEEIRPLHPKRADLLDALLITPKREMLLSELLEKTGVSSSVVDTLVKEKILKKEKALIDRSPLKECPFFQTEDKKLSPEQQIALSAICSTLGSFAPHLLYGVTGSGKTEVYLQAMRGALKKGQSILFLVPEISLTTQTIERIKSRFSEKIAVLHHRLSSGEKHDAWQQIQKGEVRIVIGARSALFAPLQNLGLIIVDEEHEGAYKQSDEMPSYNARDVAVMRAKMEDAVCVLGSATPSLESMYNAKNGKYHLHTLMQRAKNATLAKTTVVDMKEEFAKAKGFTLFSDPLLTAIKERVEKGEQSLLFLNRRGYSSAHLCRHCSYASKCPNCDLTLTFHRGKNHLTCHLCDYELTPIPKQCPSCGREDGLKFSGSGTEQVEATLHAIFPEVRTLRLDADTTKHKGSAEKLFSQFRSGKADVLIGTQMIAKGLHFPSVTLVGILYIDAALNIPDFRASESVFQLLTQVSGRAGRSDLPGAVIIQTHMPENSTIRFAKEQDYTRYFEDEIAVRQMFAYPPFSQFIKLTFSGENEEEVIEFGNAIRSLLLQSAPQTCEIHPLIPCGYAKINKRYRYQFLVKNPVHANFQNLPSHKKVRLHIDVNPLNTFF